VDDLNNPLRWGQTVIIDTDRLTLADGSVVDMESMARGAVEAANRSISTAEHHFRVKNTRTFDETSPHREQRGSATFHAVSDIGIPAFGVETSKEIADEAQRVGYQVLVINAFMEALGIVPDHPRFALEAPLLHFLTVSVDGAAPVVVENGGTLAVPPGAELRISHVEANYERGLIVDVVGVGGLNDRRQPFRIDGDTRVVVRKDKYPCGEVLLRADAGATVPVHPSPSTAASDVRIEAFRVAVNGELRLVPPGEILRVRSGDTLVLSDPLGSGDPRSYDLNLRGFVGNQVVNDGEDRGYQVHTEHDFLQRFSLSPDRERYEVRAERGTIILATAVVEIIEARFRYLLARLDDGPRLALADGDTLSVGDARTLLLESVVSDPHDAGGFRVNLRGFPGPEGAEDRGHLVDLRRDMLPAYSLGGADRFYEILIQRGTALAGRIVLDLGAPPAP
jgi:hypothetical protein